MKFGLWVEPEMVNPDSDLYRAHPDWILHFPGRPRTQIRNQHILDFGRPEVIDYIFDSLDRLVRENDVDFFKWDMNRYATEPGSVAGLAIWQTHVRGLYGLMDRLRVNHPLLSIQSCSGGGGRADLGILARTDQVWTSDNTDPHDRALIQEGFSLFYPPRTMEAWVTHEKSHQTGRLSSLDLRFDVAMRGSLGLGLALDQLSLLELEACRRKIVFYKLIRPVVQNGILYRLAELSEGSGLSIWLSVSQGRQEAVYSFVRLQHPQGHHMAPVRLRGLDEETTYAVIDEFGVEKGRFYGAQLMFLGLPGDGENGGLGETVRSRTLLLKEC
jgi:alpha-galactosidase